MLRPTILSLCGLCAVAAITVAMPSVQSDNAPTTSTIGSQQTAGSSTTAALRAEAAALAARLAAARAAAGANSAAGSATTTAPATGAQGTNVSTRQPRPVTAPATSETKELSDTAQEPSTSISPTTTTSATQGYYDDDDEGDDDDWGDR